MSFENSFVITADDLHRERNRHYQLDTYLNTEQYLYVQGHVVKNDSQYVERIGDGEYFLTFYARKNIEKCCLLFHDEPKIGKDLEITHNYTYPHQLDQELSFYSESEECNLIRMLCSQQNSPHMEENFKKFKKIFENRQNILMNLPPSFGETLRLLMEKQEETSYSLAKRTGISSSTVDRYIRNTHLPTMDILFKICIALQLPPILSNNLLYKARINYNLFSKNDQALYSLLTYAYDMDYNNVLAIAQMIDPSTHKYK